MAGIFPKNGLAPGVDNSGIDLTTTPVTGCEALYYSEICSQKVDPKAHNRIISEFVGLFNAAGLRYDCADTDNLTEAVKAMVAQCFSTLGITAPPTTFRGMFVFDNVTDPASITIYAWDCATGAYKAIYSGGGGVADMPPYTYKMRNASTTGAPQDVNVLALPADTAPLDTKYLITHDPTSGAFAKTRISELGFGTPSNPLIEIPPVVGSMRAVVTQSTDMTNMYGAEGTPSSFGIEVSNKLTAQGASSTSTWRCVSGNTTGSMNASDNVGIGLFIRMS